MKTLFVSIFLFFLMVLVSCNNEDQKVVKKLDGTWVITDIAALSIAAPLPASTPTSGEIMFEVCELKEDGRCDGSLTLAGNGTTAMTYIGLGEPTELSIRVIDEEYPLWFPFVMDIEKIDDKSLVFSGQMIVKGVERGVRITCIK